MRWTEIKNPLPSHYEEYIAGVAGGLTLRVRGPRGGSVYRWSIESGARGAKDFQRLAHGTSVERDMAQRAAEHRAAGLTV